MHVFLQMDKVLNIFILLINPRTQHIKLDKKTAEAFSDFLEIIKYHTHNYGVYNSVFQVRYHHMKQANLHL